MTPAATVGLLWLVFGGTHVGLATRAVRARLVARLGENGFIALYSTVAAASFIALVGTYAVVRDGGAPGLGATGWLRATAARLGSARRGGSVPDSPASSLSASCSP
jgi:hypothetical protein